MEANKNKNLGNAGEFYVLAQLAQRGYIAGKTDDGTTLIDVIATNPDTLSTVNIQVKTRTIDGRKSSWMMGRKNEEIHKNLWYVVVEIGSDEEIAGFKEEYNNGISWGDAKNKLFDKANDSLLPIRERYFELKEQKDLVKDHLSDGAKKVRPLAQEFIEEIRSKIGIS